VGNGTAREDADDGLAGVAAIAENGTAVRRGARVTLTADGAGTSGEVLAGMTRA